MEQKIFVTMTAIKISIYLCYFDIQYQPVQPKLLYFMIQSARASLYFRLLHISYFQNISLWRTVSWKSTNFCRPPVCCLLQYTPSLAPFKWGVANWQQRGGNIGKQHDWLHLFIILRKSMYHQLNMIEYSAPGY